MTTSPSLRSFLEALGQVVRSRRKLLGLSQEELAERSGLHRTYVTDVERGVRNLTFESALKLASALQLPVQTIVGMVDHGVGPEVGKPNAAAEILLVEDNPKDLELTIGALQRHSLVNRVATASTGKEALTFLGIEASEHPAAPKRLPSLVLLDLRLPDLDGNEVLRRIRSDERTARVPVVILTASRSDIDYRESVRWGVSGYLTKPVDWLEFSMMMPKFGFRWMLLGQSPLSTDASPISTLDAM